MQPTILTIAGSDSSGGAGIQADLKAIAANGGYGASVITSLTAQNTRGVTLAAVVSAPMLGAQLEAVFADLDIVSVKTGMLASDEVISIVAAALARYSPAHLVCDPVMISKTGYRLLPPACVDTLRARLFPLASLVTPNVHEAEALSGVKVETPSDAAEAGKLILESGAAAVLVKGGHLRESPATDVLVTPAGVETFPGEPVDSRHTHGTGCTYSAAIATWLGRGLDLPEAIRLAKEFVTEAIRGGLEVGGGTGPTNPFFYLRSPEEAGSWLSRWPRGDARRRAPEAP